ncbi:MAG TPA: 2Fe-2S iron-sulfur cluster-binding protein [Chitinophagaceae bacterium]|jgi:Ferredoxin
MSAQPPKNIKISVFYEGETYEFDTYTNEYRSLMMLIYDKLYTEGFGECLGMGKCGTCLIEILENKYPLTFYERNEVTTLVKAGYTGKEVHLSCQVMVNEFMDGLKVKIL